MFLRPYFEEDHQSCKQKRFYLEAVASGKRPTTHTYEYSSIKDSKIMHSDTRYPGLSLFQANDLASTRPDPPPAQKDFFALFDLFRFVTHAWAAMLYAFVRRGFGRGFFGLRGMGGLVVLSGWAVVQTPPEEAFPLTVMMAMFVAMTFWHRLQARKGLDGVIQHSGYSGWPRVCDFLPISERDAKIFIEPGVIFMTGIGITWLNQSLGMFIAIGAFACLIDWLYMARRDYRRAKQLHDAEHEHQALEENYEHYFNK